MSTINIYDLNYTDAFKLGIRNYANFNGRVSRSEYWRFVAGGTLIQGLLGVLAFFFQTIGKYFFSTSCGTSLRADSCSRGCP